MPAAPPTQFRTPHGIVGSRDGLIYLSDRANNRIQVFRQNGEFVREKILRPRCGAQEKATWTPKRPCGNEATFSLGFSPDPAADLHLQRRRRLALHHRAAAQRSRSGERVRRPGVGLGQLGRPHNLTVDPSGNIFVAEAQGPKVKHPTTGATVQAGFRAQKFTFTGVYSSRSQ